MNKPLTDDLVSIVAHQPRPDAGRHRTPAEMGEQLVRNAKSLELTGAHLVKDQAFYEAVAVDLREASAFLMDWQALVDHMKREATKREETTRVAALLKAGSMAAIMADLVPAAFEGPSKVWRQACTAVAVAVNAFADSTFVTPQERPGGRA